MWGYQVVIGLVSLVSSTVQDVPETVLVSLVILLLRAESEGSFLIAFVNNNPGAFTNAFWDIAAVRVFT